VRRLSLSAHIAPPSEELEVSLQADRVMLPEVWEANSRRNEDEPVRLKLTFIAARIEATRAVVASRDAGHPAELPAAYVRVDDLKDDLMLVHDSLRLAGATHTQRTVLNPLLAAIRTYGFHGMMMDVRDHADSHRAALEEIASAVGHAPFDEEGLRSELKGRRPLIGTNVGLSDETKRVVDTFAAIKDDPGGNRLRGGLDIHRVDDKELRRPPSSPAARTRGRACRSDQRISAIGN
jgi:Phosphoenolpyruvate carboxylase